MLRRIDHVMVLVRDAGSAFATCTERLGFPASWQPERHEGWENAAVWMGNASMELLSPLDESGSTEAAFFARALEERGEGVFMVAFDPGDIESAVRDLRGHGVQVSDPVSGSGGDGGVGQGRSYRTAIISRQFTPGLNSFICQYDPPFRPMDGGRGALKIKKLDHVVIATEDLEDAAAKWGRNLGLKVTERVSRPLGAGFEVARLPVGDAFIELVQPVEEKGRFYEQFKERGEGFFSISVEVDDLDAAIGYLREKGAKVSEPEPGIWAGSRVARISQSSAHGVSIQLIERG